MFDDRNILSQEKNTIKLPSSDRKLSEMPSQLTVECLNSFFTELPNEEDQYDNEMIDNIRRCAKEEILISSDQFEYLVNLATSAPKYKIAKGIIKIINIYSSIENNQWFLSVVPQNFLERISIFLPHSYIFEIYQNCLHKNPDETLVILEQMNIIEFILDNLYKCESVLLYSELLRNSKMESPYNQYFQRVVSETIQNFNETKDSDYIFALYCLVNNKECAQAIIQDPEFCSIFMHKKYTHYTRIELMHLICSLCQPDKSNAMLITSSPVWEFINKSKEINDQIKESKNKKLDLNQYFLLFLFYLGETNDGKLFLFENKIHSTLFETIKNGLFKDFDKSVGIICQIGLIRDANVISELIQSGLIELLTESILCLSLDSKRKAIDCLSNIQAIGEINDIYDFQSVIFDNEELMEAVDRMILSDDKCISDFSRALYMRYRDW